MTLVAKATTMSTMDLKTYITEHGCTAKLAGEIGIAPAYLRQMASGIRPVPHKTAVVLERLTDGTVTRRDLFPNDWHEIWPELAEVA